MKPLPWSRETHTHTHTHICVNKKVLNWVTMATDGKDVVLRVFRYFTRYTFSSPTFHTSWECMHKRIRLHVVNKDMLLWEGTSTFACIEICRGMGELQGECVFVCVWPWRYQSGFIGWPVSGGDKRVRWRSDRLQLRKQNHCELRSLFRASAQTHLWRRLGPPLAQFWRESR